ncbi:MAG TPA: hypothetical protein PL183_06905 [Aquamicrobium sp.]|nr:hypothetical protein [Aquamicrobium sp.]
MARFNTGITNLETGRAAQWIPARWALRALGRDDGGEAVFSFRALTAISCRQIKYK